VGELRLCRRRRATTDLAKKAGAAVFVEPRTFRHRRMAVFADTTGAAIGIWQPKTFNGAELANGAGSFAWTELNTVTSQLPRPSTQSVRLEANDMDMGGMSYTSGDLGTSR